MQQKLKKILDPTNAVFAVFLVLALSLIYNTLSVIQKNYTLQAQVDELEQEVSLIELENQNLAFNIEYFKTDAYLEVEAKRRFNLAGEGEKAVLFAKDGDLPVTEEDDDVVQEVEQKSQYQENFDAWMTFLFGSNS